MKEDTRAEIDAVMATYYFGKPKAEGGKLCRQNFDDVRLEFSEDYSVFQCTHPETGILFTLNTVELPEEEIAAALEFLLCLYLTGYNHYTV